MSPTSDAASLAASAVNASPEQVQPKDPVTTTTTNTTTAPPVRTTRTTTTAQNRERKLSHLETRELALRKTLSDWKKHRAEHVQGPQREVEFLKLLQGAEKLEGDCQRMENMIRGEERTLTQLINLCNLRQKDAIQAPLLNNIIRGRMEQQQRWEKIQARGLKLLAQFKVEIAAWKEEKDHNGSQDADAESSNEPSEDKQCTTTEAEKDEGKPPLSSREQKKRKLRNKRRRQAIKQAKEANESGAGSAPSSENAAASAPSDAAVELDMGQMKLED